MFRFIVPALLFLLAGNASAKDLNILTGAGMSMPVKAMAADFGARTGAHVTVVSDTAGGVQKRMEAGEKFDLVIGTTGRDGRADQGRQGRERTMPTWRRWWRASAPKRARPSRPSPTARR